MKSRTSTGNVMKSTQAVQMGGGVNPNWWSIRPAPPATTITSYEQQQQHHPPYNLFLHQPPNNNNFLPSYNPPNSIILSPYSPQPTSSSNSSSWHEHDNHQQQQDHHQQLPSETWSQLLLGGMDQEEGEKQSAAATAALTHQQFQTAANKLKMHNWDQNPVMLQQQQHLHDLNYESSTSIMDIKKEHQSVPSSCYNMFGHGNEEFLQAAKTTAAWSSINVMMSNNSSPPKSCVTSFGNNNNNSMLNFSSNSKGDNGIRHPAPVDHPISESNSSGTGGASKKARVQPSLPDQSNTFKVRKEKLGDRITALHQLVSPFGKTDTASVLLETMGYIRFLQSQIEALSLPYLASGLGSTRQQRQHQQQQQPLMHAQSESICIFPEDPGQEASEKEPEKDLRSRGLCLVPLSCTLQVESDNGADYWASPPAFGGGFR